MKILIIVTSTGTFANGKLATGLWLSEFTHIYHSAKESGYDITVANPKGGYTPIDPESLKPIFLDEMSEKYWEKPEFKNGTAVLKGHIADYKPEMNLKGRARRTRCDV